LAPEKKDVKDVLPDVSIRFYLRCGLIYRRSGSRIHVRARAWTTIFSVRIVRKYMPGNISVVPVHTIDATGTDGEGWGEGDCRLQASIVDTGRYNRLLPITSNMSSRADDEESSIILQNKMARVWRASRRVHT